MPAKSYETGPPRRENPGNNVWSPSGGNLAAKDLGSRRKAKKAHIQIHINISTQEYILSRSVQTQFCKWGTSHQWRIRTLPSNGGNPTLRVDRL